MSRLNEANVILAREIIGRYPKARSATIPLLHLSQQQNGYVTNEAIAHVAELVGATSAEILGTATFYEMFKFEPVGKYLINICGTMSCQLLGADDLMHHAEQRLGVRAGGTTADGMFTLEHAECQAACTEAPNMQVNYRHCHRMTTTAFDQLVDDLAAGPHAQARLGVVHQVVGAWQLAAHRAADVDEVGGVEVGQSARLRRWQVVGLFL